ncbi:tripartite motif-containing protein 75-like [Engraulis encrasicolus]|uniref:tripartite motif-containing protein 75-like n=1 Tax=Engraulis encrasicolus TaxID=184585 RepID=UPI002FD2886F
MASSGLSEEILCPVCLGEFQEPVSLRCQHSFCRRCISTYLATSGGAGLCPECRHPFNKKHIKANRSLAKVVSAAKEHLEEQRTLQESLTSVLLEPAGSGAEPVEDPALMCSVHQERLKLFCTEDQQLLCVVCREAEQHHGHTCRPAEEVAQHYKGLLGGAVNFLSTENASLNYMIGLQSAEVLQTQERSRDLSAMISSEFVKLQQLLRDQEQKVLSRLQEEETRVLVPMQTNLNMLTQLISMETNTEQVLTSNLSNTQPITFLQWWTSVGSGMVEEMLHFDSDPASSEEHTSSTEQQRLWFSSKLEGLGVCSDVINLGPYESHLPFLVWKQVLNHIHIQQVPHADELAQWEESYSRVGLSGRSLQRVDRKLGGLLGVFRGYRPMARCHPAYGQGRHYWEVEVGRRPDWAVGVCVAGVSQLCACQGMCVCRWCATPQGALREQVMLHLKRGRGYSVTVSGAVETPVALWEYPRRVGVYLDCDRGRVEFYDADTLLLIHSSKMADCQHQDHTAGSGREGPLLSLCLSPGCYNKEEEGRGDWEPLTVCCYRRQRPPGADMELLGRVWRPSLLGADEALWWRDARLGLAILGVAAGVMGVTSGWGDLGSSRGDLGRSGGGVGGLGHSLEDSIWW